MTVIGVSTLPAKEVTARARSINKIKFRHNADSASETNVIREVMSM